MNEFDEISRTFWECQNDLSKCDKNGAKLKKSLK